MADDDSLFDEDEGEDLVGFNMDAGRREALERQRNSTGEGERRLSRDLEEGFRDDSEDESDGASQEHIERSSITIPQS
jgi:hypothetical protein